MTQEAYPDKVPEKLAPVRRFTFSFDAGEQAKKENDLRIGALEDRIKRLSDKCVIDDLALIPAILKVTHDPTQLRTLSKVLDRVADLVPELDVLVRRNQVLQIADEDASWMAGAFGDFSSDLDSTIDAIPHDQDIIAFIEGLT